MEGAPESDLGLPRRALECFPLTAAGRGSARHLAVDVGTRSRLGTSGMCDLSDCMRTGEKTVLDEAAESDESGAPVFVPGEDIDMVVRCQKRAEDGG